MTLPLPAGPLRFNVEMWVLPYEARGLQTIASTDSAPQVRRIQRNPAFTYFRVVILCRY